MSIQTPDYEAEFLRSIQENAKLVVDQLNANDEGILKKIATFSTRYGFPIEAVKEKILNDAMFAAIFTKDPGKQKIHENIAAGYIKTIDGVENFKQLGHNAFVVFQGRVSSRKEVFGTGASATAKTIDFEWSFNGKKIYASHKYTKQSGGAQDNQYRDLQEFLREANESNLKDTFFLAIADGAYYEGQDQGSGTTKLGRLQQIANGRNTFALTINDLENWLIEHCK